ncbi:glycosyltransferase family 2 protein [Azohydromonas caseinilytica]|uniref:Glycosyltransferase family 2 protein n=1 Tax=Azohydromonas caseinilytica TaxID=2728836 RepID=A0A848FHM8_9BURK|nr:glycosyltransferase family 2 protein [Azohydromonas caseinilytica]NML18988.1 glycosyltransferase family 2 protein [Azohydromonas caseinilytica]
MDLSIIIVNWNSKDLLADALASVQENVKGITYEVVVIDSGSFDGCAKMLSQAYPWVRFIQSDTNLGFAKANNEAYQMSTGEVLLFLNPDTKVVGNAIQDLLQVLRSRPDAGLVGPKLLNADGSVQETCIRAFPTLLNQLLDSDVLRRHFPNSSLWGKRALKTANATPQRVEALSGASIMMSRKAFERVGLFSTEYFMYSEDMDLCLKAARAGFQAYYVPTAVVVHFGGASSSQSPTSNFSAVMRLESQWRFFRKMHSARYAAAYRAAMFLASLLRISALALLLPLQALIPGKRGVVYSLRKWVARLRWTVGTQAWMRNY